MPRLLPLDLDEKVIKRIIYFHRKISRLPIGAISMGSFVHSDLCSQPKIPFIGPVRNGFISKSSIFKSLQVLSYTVNPFQNLTKKLMQY